MRFANHADFSLANCIIKIVFSKGTYHAVLVANRDIDENEELFFDYNIKKDLDWLTQYNEKFVFPYLKPTKQLPKYNWMLQKTD